tara:strand:+ start:122 stop:412 length:291 start_codon:yes stop_codon:yes gene_type:complete
MDMKKVVIAKLKSKHEKFEELKNFLKKRVPEARTYNGCHGAHVCVDEEDKAVILYEIWNSIDDHKKYVSWRKEQGVHETISNMLRERSFSYYTYLI